MSLIKGKHTAPEMTVRRLVYGLGYRYRLHAKLLPGKPDLVFARLRKVIFVHGCFWHRHPSPNCRLARLPKSRHEFWIPKLEGNATRDQENQRKLRKLGWKSLVIWECQIKNLASLKRRLQTFLEQ